MWIKVTPTSTRIKPFFRLFLEEQSLSGLVEKKSMPGLTCHALILQEEIRKNSAEYFQVERETVYTWR